MAGRFEEIREGVYAYIQSGGWFGNNAGFVVCDGYTIVIDSLSNEDAATDMLRRMREVSDAPVRFIINTHGHPDHVWTNHVFNATAICHENAKRDTLTAFVEVYEVLFPELNFRGARITPQDVTFRNAVTLHGGKELRVVHPGIAHTAGDAYVHLPREKIVFCGDLLFAKPCTPLVLTGSVRGCMRALDELIALDAEYYVPGHGDVAGVEELVEAKEYLRYIYEEAAKRFEAGMNWYDAALDIDLGEYGKWRESERVVGNVARVYAELEGRDLHPTELVEVTRRMLELRRGGAE